MYQAEFSPHSPRLKYFPTKYLNRHPQHPHTMSWKYFSFMTLNIAHIYKEAVTRRVKYCVEIADMNCSL